MADQHHLPPLAHKAGAMQMHLGDQRARGVEHGQLALAGRLDHRFGHAMGGKHRCRAVGDLIQFFDKHRPQRFQPVHHMGVVHDFVADIDRWAKAFQRLFDNGDGAFHAGAKAAR